MCFFCSVILILIMILSSFIVYQYLTCKNIKKDIIFIYLIFLQAILILFSGNVVVSIFLDFPCFIAYMLKKRREALILSIINVLFYAITFKISWLYYLIYIFYFIIDYILRNNSKLSIKVLVLSKTFLTSFVYFLYFEHSSIYLLYIIFIFLYFYLLLNIVYNFFKYYNEKKNNDNIIFQIAHEVKNPIAVCKGYLDMLDLKKQDKVNKYIPIVRSEMSRALTIMDDFLNLKRLSINKGIMDMMMLLEDVSITMESILKNKHVSLSLPEIDDEVLLEADYDRLKQVFINLIKNSYEANSKNIKIDLFTKKNRLVVTILDDGDGISESDLKRIGQLFYTTKSKGNGIGISILKEIIKLHDGDVLYDSKVNVGTKVTIELPSYINF